MLWPASSRISAVFSRNRGFRSATRSVARRMAGAAYHAANHGDAIDRRRRAAYARSMKSLLCACIISYCAVASSGCDSSAAGKAVVGSYSVTIASMGKSDPDVMTVSPGTDGKLLFTFIAGVTTDVGAVNANGLRADFND